MSVVKEINANIFRLLQPLNEASAAKQQLGSDILRTLVTGLTDLVTRASGVAPKIYKPVLQAQQALLEQKWETCQEYLTTLMAQVSLGGVSGGPLGQLERIGAEREPGESLERMADEKHVVLEQAFSSEKPPHLHQFVKLMIQSPDLRGYFVSPRGVFLG